MEESFKKLIPGADSEVKIQISYAVPENNPEKSEHSFAFDVTNPYENSNLKVSEVLSVLFKKSDSGYFPGLYRSIEI